MSIKKLFRKAYAETLKNLRPKLGVTQKDISDKLGLKDCTAISKVESEKRDVYLWEAYVVAEALNLHPRDLIEIIDRKRKEIQKNS